MDAKTLAALQGSIAKWEKIAFHDGKDEGYKNCPLCQHFLDDVSKLPHCDGCPVALDTGVDGCDLTPYDEWSDYLAEAGGADCVFDQTSKDLAVKEMEYLKSLLPSDESHSDSK